MEVYSWLEVCLGTTNTYSLSGMVPRPEVWLAAIIEIKKVLGKRAPGWNSPFVLTAPRHLAQESEEGTNHVTWAIYYGLQTGDLRRPGVEPGGLASIVDLTCSATGGTTMGNV